MDRTLFHHLSVPHPHGAVTQNTTGSSHARGRGSEGRAVVRDDAHGGPRREGVLVGGEVLEFPVVLLRLVLDAFLDVGGGELPAGVLEPSVMITISTFSGRSSSFIAANSCPSVSMAVQTASFRAVQPEHV